MSKPKKIENLQGSIKNIKEVMTVSESHFPGKICIYSKFSYYLTHLSIQIPKEKS